jgi:UDP-N-acetylmuramate: L-alanyl-gamma-D-glutamyl-meso-diaminopimelate ligase
MRIHFIAIGGSAMHNLAIALKRKGYHITGSDDTIFEPSKSRLLKEGILPNQEGWFPEKISADLDAVIVGMHARQDNPELLRAIALNLPIFSYPEYIYEQTKNQTRIVIGGSHGKTTITSMLLHVCRRLNLIINYVVGAQLEGYDCMVCLDDAAQFAILEGDEYLSSPTDLRPKFHLYRPNIALISGIAWDHINVFPTFENYVEQFDLFCSKIEPEGVLIYNQEDAEVKKLSEKYEKFIKTVAYGSPRYEVQLEGTQLEFEGVHYPLQIFGRHNIQNAMGAMRVGEQIGISPKDFLNALRDFKGASKRLQLVAKSSNRLVYKDFAHSPSKLKATVRAVREQYPEHRLSAYMELHTFSSLNKDFLPQYEGCMDDADDALVYYNPKVVAQKRLSSIQIEDVKRFFGAHVQVVNETQAVLDTVYKQIVDKQVILFMTSGNFDGLDLDQLGMNCVNLV